MPPRIAATAADMPLPYQDFNNYAQGILAKQHVTDPLLSYCRRSGA